MKKGEPNFIPSRSTSAGLKLILKVGNSSTSECINANETFSESNQVSSQRMSPQKYTDDFKRHKKYKKKKRKKEKHEKKKRHHKEKRKYAEIQDEGFNYYGSPKKTLINIDSFGDVLSSSSDRISAGGSNLIAENIRSEKVKNTSLQKLLDYIQDNIESRDTQNFFKWPVTDQIAPGYSMVISQPMDLNTMKLKINRGMYNSLADYMADFKLMCKNAMVYNHPDTVYYKSAKKLLHFGIKITNSERLQSLRPVLPFLNEITDAELGILANSTEESLPADVTMKTNNEIDSNNVTVKLENKELSAEEILSQVQEASKRVHGDRKKPKMGFLRQTDDGYTSLAILVPNEGVNKETRERPVLLGAMIGKSGHAGNSWQPFKEDKRNTVKPVKPLNYGSFGSYAPSYDSTFANLTKEETDLLYQTYGDDSAIQYAESLLDFSKDSDYTTVMVDSLLDIMTSGEHRKTKKILEERKKCKEQDDLKVTESKTKSTVSHSSDDNNPITDTAAANTTSVTGVTAVPSTTTNISTVTTVTSNITTTASDTATTVSNTAVTTTTTNTTTSSETVNANATSNTITTASSGVPNLSSAVDPSCAVTTTSTSGVTSTASTASSTVGAGLDCLKSLSDLGIDTSFVDYYEELLKDEQIMKNKLMHTKALLEKLHQAQTDRLSNPPTSLVNIAVPSEFETQLADKVTENLKNVIKKIPPSVVAPMNSIRKALGISIGNNGTATDYYNNNNNNMPNEGNDAAVDGNSSENNATTNTETSRSSVTGGGGTSVSNILQAPGIDLESELREFLESDTELSHFELSDDDKTIEQMLSESS